MTYKLVFDDIALKEWKKLSAPLKDQFKKKLAENVQSGVGKTCKICRATLQNPQFRKW